MPDRPAPAAVSGSSSVLRAAGAMGAATFLSRILGLVREQVIGILFGAGNATDAYTIAFRIPNLLRDLFAEGAMSSAFVPTFTRTRLIEGDRKAWRLAGLVFRVLAITVTLLSVVGILFAPELVSLYASSYKQVPGKFEMTVLMTRIMFPFFPLVALAAAYMGVLNSCGKFFLPAFASALFNLASIVTGVGLAFVFPRYGMDAIVGMAVGVVAGGAVQAFSQLPELYRQGYRWEPKAAEDPSWRKEPALRNMLGLMVPGMVGLGATQVNILVNSILATSQGPGAVSFLSFAFRLLQFPIGIFGVSLAAATLPRVSALWVKREFDGITETLTRSLRHVFAINLPAAAGLAFLGIPIVRLLFEYGRFTPESTQGTAAALAAYAIGLPAYSAVKVLVPACYAMGNTRLPVLSSILAVAVTVVTNLALVGPFGFQGLALGTSLAAMFNALFLLWAVRRMLGAVGVRFGFRPLLLSFVAYTAISLVMGTLCLISHEAMDRVVSDGVLLETLGRGSVPLVRAAKVGIGMLEGALLVLCLAKLLKLDEATEVFGIFGKKLKKKLSRQGT